MRATRPLGATLGPCDLGRNLGRALPAAHCTSHASPAAGENGNQVPQGIRKMDLDQVHEPAAPPAPAVLQLAAPPLPRHPLPPLRLPSDAADPRSRAQVYKRAKGNLSKPARLAFRELDNMVGIATSVKDLRSEDP